MRRASSHHARVVGPSKARGHAIACESHGVARGLEARGAVLTAPDAAGVRESVRSVRKTGFRSRIQPQEYCAGDRGRGCSD